MLNVILLYPFLNLLTFFIWLSPGHYAAAGIVLLTLLVRFILLIPTKRTAQVQRKMAQLQPLLDELKIEYKDDRNGLAVAQMELYKKNGINPLSSCLLPLIQLPILFILYQAILHGLTPNNPNLYSWVPRPDFINLSLFGIDLSKPDHWLILPILSAVTQLVLARLTLPPKPAEGTVVDPQTQAMQNTQRTMLYLFPLVTFVLARNFPAGVALYWVVSNLFSIVQQTLVNRERLNLVGVDKVVDTAEKSHPERKSQMETVKAEVLGKEVKKDGVSVTVRKKNK